MCSTSRLRSVNTFIRLSRAAFRSKLGLTVVVPMSSTCPFSRNGRKASCWALLKRWISSMKITVCREVLSKK